MVLPEHQFRLRELAKRLVREKIISNSIYNFYKVKALTTSRKEATQSIDELLHLFQLYNLKWKLGNKHPGAKKLSLTA